MEVQFFDEIEFEVIELEAARDVVTYSFIVQKSLTYLDLSACEYMLNERFIFTEEQCRKHLEPRRQILYTYHLDLPEKLEHSLRDIKSNTDDQEQYEAFHLGVMFVGNCLYNRDLENYVINPIMSARDRTEKLRRYMEVMKLLNFNECRGTSMRLFDNLIPALYPFCNDSNLVVDFAVTFCFASWLFYRDDPILVSYVLDHAVQIRYNIFQESESGLDPINGCIVFHSPRNICMLLIYGTLLRFHREVYLEVTGRLLGRRLIRRIVRKNIPDRRLFLILQLFYYFLFNNHYREGLIYIWRSIPDPCLSECEISFLFASVISSRRLNKLIEYYKFSIVEESAEIRDEVPRPLQHLCRVAVRSALIRNYQLPYGICKLGMPPLIRDYLNLKC